MRKRKPRFFHPYPKYLQVSDILRNRILTQMRPGDRIVPEVDLSKEFGVSRETVRQALAPLEREGLITRSRGRGSFVGIRIPFRAPKKLTGLTEDFVQRRTYKIIRKDIVRDDEEACAFLRVPNDALLVSIERVSSLEDQPFAYHVAKLPAEVGMRVMQEDLNNESIASLLAERCGYRLEEDQQIIEAETADVRLAEHLNVHLGFPILVMRRTYISNGEQPIAYFKSYYRADRYMYTVALRQYEGHRRVVAPKLSDAPVVAKRRRSRRKSPTNNVPRRADFE